jgi:hypothetical protein
MEGSSENLDASFKNLSKPPRWMITDLFASLAANLRRRECDISLI